MTTKRSSADFFSELEGDASPFAAAPRHMARPRLGRGNQTVAISSVRQAVLDALLASGYERQLAEKIADETALQVPVIEQKMQSAA